MTQHRTGSQTGSETNEDERIGALVAQLSTDVSRLVRNELQLAKVELKDKGREAGIGVGLFGGAGTLALYGVGAMVTAAILGLAHAVPAWLSALIVAAVLFAVAAIAGLLGKRRVAGATPPLSGDVVHGVHEDIEALKGHQPEGRATA